MDSKSIPNCLRLYRKRCGLKQQDVARKLGLKSACMISRWEKGLVMPDMENIFMLSLVYHTSSDALYCDYRSILNERIQRDEKG